MPRAARRAQVIEAAAGAFLDGGYDGTSMEDVARAAGVSRLIVYRIFESKHELYRAVLMMVMSELGQRFEGLDAVTVEGRGATKLILPTAREHPDAFRLLCRHAALEPGSVDIAAAFRMYVERYARAILEGYLGDDPVMLDWAARTAGAHLVDGLCNWIDVGDPDRDEEFGDLMTRGIRAMAAGWRTGAKPASV